MPHGVAALSWWCGDLQSASSSSDALQATHYRKTQGTYLREEWEVSTAKAGTWTLVAVGSSAEKVSAGRVVTSWDGEGAACTTITVEESAR